MAYRVNILGSEAAANGDVHLDVQVEKQDGESWVSVPNGHRTLVLDGQAVLAITEGAGTTAQKRVALLALFRQEVLNWGVDEADNANTQLVALLPAGFPVAVNL